MEGARRAGYRLESQWALWEEIWISCLLPPPRPAWPPPFAQAPPMPRHCHTMCVPHHSTGTLKWCLGRGCGGRATGKKGDRGSGAASGRGDHPSRSWVAGGELRRTRTRGEGEGWSTGQRWGKNWNAAPLRGLHGAQEPGTSPPPPDRRRGPILGKKRPQTRSPEASLPPGPARS